jgi:hypothetical protein
MPKSLLANENKAKTRIDARRSQKLAPEDRP